MLKVYRNHDRKDGLVGSWRFDSRIGEAESGVYKNPLAWQPSVRSLNGSHTLSSVSVDLQKEYYEMILNVTASDGYWCGEFQVPDSYMGLDVFAYEEGNWVLKNGASGYTLSVPYVYDYTDKLTGSAYSTGSSIPKDWGSDSLVKGSSVSGSKYRVQLRINSSMSLKVLVWYMSLSGIGFDGVNDGLTVLKNTVSVSKFSFGLRVKLVEYADSFNGVVTKGGGHYGGFRLYQQRGYDYLVFAYEGYDDVMRWILSTNGYTVLGKMCSLFIIYNSDVSLAKLSYERSFVRSSTSVVNLKENDYNIQIGRDPWDGYFKGIIEDFVFYDTLYLNEEDIEKYYKGEIRKDGLTIYISSKSLEGATMKDLSGNNYGVNCDGNVHYKVWSGNSFRVTVV